MEKGLRHCGKGLYYISGGGGELERKKGILDWKEVGVGNGVK